MSFFKDETLRNIPDVVLAVHERATRNVPWVTQAWIRYLLALERAKADSEKVCITRALG